MWIRCISHQKYTSGTRVAGAGADDFLPKPIRTEQLLDMLEQHVSLEWCYADEHIQDDTPRPSPSFMSLPAGNLPAVEELARLYE